MRAFFDTNVLIYTIVDDHRQETAKAILGGRGLTSAQVLNEFVNVALRKLRMDWASIDYAVERFEQTLDEVVSVSVATNAAARRLCRDHGLSFYDALIVAAAQEAGCDTLYTEDMQDGRRFGDLTISNPFRG